MVQGAKRGTYPISFPKMMRGRGVGNRACAPTCSGPHPVNVGNPDLVLFSPDPDPTCCDGYILFIRNYICIYFLYLPNI